MIEQVRSITNPACLEDTPFFFREFCGFMCLSRTLTLEETVLLNFMCLLKELGFF